MEFRHITYEVRDAVAWLTLNRPEKLNAMTWASWAEVENAISAADGDDGVRAVVITGAGRGFCAGTDLTAADQGEDEVPRPFPPREALTRSRYRATELVWNCRKPVVAAVNGPCVGAGFSLALACDIRIASEQARFSAIFVRRGLSADMGCTWFLPRIVGLSEALRMLYTGRMVDAQEALRLGLVSEVVPHEELLARVEAFAADIAHGPTVAIETMKRLARESLTADLASHIEREEYLQQAVRRTEDFQEGVRSFLEKREPVFRGR
ncbi:putative enoyl-CoA hydratase echA12 [bacterium HR29]|nr:putative enoyl-CoA hydratase echA12 [bacterium HR29]